MTVNNLEEKMQTVTTTELSKWLGISESTLKRWRKVKKGPNFVFVGEEPRYRISDVEKYLSKREVVCA